MVTSTRDIAGRLTIGRDHEGVRNNLWESSDGNAQVLEYARRKLGVNPHTLALLLGLEDVGAIYKWLKPEHPLRPSNVFLTRLVVLTGEAAAGHIDITDLDNWDPREFYSRWGLEIY